MQVAKSVRIAGRVQGVFFRAWAQQQAESLGLSGWVRNCPDGSVLALVSGDEAAVGQMIERLHAGPPSAVVETVEVDEAAPDESGRFEIRG